MLKLYRNFLMAGVVSLGLAACGDDLTITEPPPAPPPVETPNITTFTVSPTSATIAPGTFVQASATLITKPGVTGAVTWNSSNPAVATVDASGRIDALTQGTTVVTATATAGGQTATAAIGVTVRPIQPAQVSIQSITTGLTNLPVNVGNVFGQIEITLNFDPGEQIVDSVAVFIGNKRAAKQSYVTSPSAGPIVLSVNTANYTKNTTTGVATVDYLNGATAISAAVYPRGSSATATNSVQINLNNSDGWAATMTSPSAFANSAAGLTYWGGPTAGGLTELTVYPVIYTPGRTVATVTFAPGNAFDGTCSFHTDTSLPFRATFGYTTAGATASGGTCGGAAGFEHTVAPGGPRDNVMIGTAIDNANNPYPLTPLIANTVVLGSTPDSLRFDWRSPALPVPAIARTLPAVTGWVNGAFNFLTWTTGSVTELGVGLRATRDRAATYSGCGATNAAMPNGTGADIPECMTNFIGGFGGAAIGAPVDASGNPLGGYTAGAAPYRVRGTESDRLGNVGTSAQTATFGVDKTTPQIRWGTISAAPALPAAATADTVFTTKPLGAGTDEFRAEYLDERSGFHNAGQPGAGATAQRHRQNRANHTENLGVCVTAGGPIGAAFVTAPACTLASITVGGPLRLDGWQAGQSVAVPLSESYHGYTTDVTDAAGNTTARQYRKVAVSTISPFASLIGVTGTLTTAAFGFTPTFADSVEVVAHSFELDYPQLPTVQLARYPRTMNGVIFDDAITSPFNTTINPPTGTPYAVRIETVSGAAFPASNIVAAPGANVKPVGVQVWAWNPGGVQTYAPPPAPAPSGVTVIPALLVANADSISRFNTLNPTIAVNHWRVISTVATTNQFGSTVPLRVQATSPTNAPNAPFVRVDFYRLDAGGTWWNYLGSSASPVGTDQGTYRSWLWSLPDASFLTDWTGAAQGATTAGDVMIAVGITAGGSGLVTAATTMVP